ncbi:MAG: hypothetical protein IJL39_00430 [Clostridia bacterium]|nr:hypothetical protein [Clostridia bacterium]
MSKESPWVKYLRENYDPGENVVLSYEEEVNLDALFDGPEQYGVESEMLDYAKSHPNATVKELCRHFLSLNVE